MGIQFIALGIAIGGALVTTGLVRIGFRTIAFTIILVVLIALFQSHTLSSYLIDLSFLPTWMKWVGATLGGLWSLQFAIGLLFGRNVADNTVGILISEIILTFARTLKGSGNILRRLFGSSDGS